MLQDREVAIDEFIKTTSAGIVIADYDQVQAALIKRYKEVYGSDIDLSNTTADGVFVNDLALIINNILQSFKILYSNLNVDTASGVYLDNLCRLSNVSRKDATHSTAQLRISSDENTILRSDTIFVDYTGNEWIYNGQDINIVAGADPISIIVTCTELGPIRATAGSIYQTLELSYLKVEQELDAALGRNPETDSELRARRTQSTGASGTTVLEGLVGALLAIDGIEDVQIINNNSAEDSPANDGTEIRLHDIYIIIRQLENLTIDNSLIGQTIYQKLTPGISTTAFDNTDNPESGENVSYTAVIDENVEWLNQIINWKKAKPIKPVCSVKIHPFEYFASDTITKIGSSLINYLNNLKISSEPSKNDMIINAVYADPKFKGGATYTVVDATLPNLPNEKNPNTYFNYTTATPSERDSDGNITIIIS